MMLAVNFRALKVRSDVHPRMSKMTFCVNPT